MRVAVLQRPRRYQEVSSSLTLMGEESRREIAILLRGTFRACLPLGHRLVCVSWFGGLWEVGP